MQVSQGSNTNYDTQRLELNSIIGLTKLISSTNYNNNSLNLYSCPEREVIFAILNGYLQDKEIEYYLNQFIFIKPSTVRYKVKKLLIKFNTTSRTELFRNLLNSKFVYHVPKSIYKKINNNIPNLNVVVF